MCELLDTQSLVNWLRFLAFLRANLRSSVMYVGKEVPGSRCPGTWGLRYRPRYRGCWYCQPLNH